MNKIVCLLVFALILPPCAPLPSVASAISTSSFFEDNGADGMDDPGPLLLAGRDYRDRYKRKREIRRDIRRHYRKEQRKKQRRAAVAGAIIGGAVVGGIMIERERRRRDCEEAFRDHYHHHHHHHRYDYDY